MGGLAALEHEIDLLEQIQTDLSALASRMDERRRQDLIDLRRKLAAQIFAVGSAAEPEVAGLNDAGILLAYREKFSRMRSVTALHQANWPAVALGERDDEYRASAMKVREANRAFVRWMRATLEQVRSMRSG